MTPGPVVSNASPPIALAQAGQLDLLRRLFGEVLVPPAVVGEIRSIAQLPTWLREQPLLQPMSPKLSSMTLGPGERHAIALALEVGASRALLDERAARRAARTLGLRVTGTLGVLLVAKRRGFLSSVKPSVEQLRTVGFHLSDEFCERFLADAGES